MAKANQCLAVKAMLSYMKANFSIMWGPRFNKDQKALEKVQRCVNKLVCALKQVFCFAFK